jgi:hypothetical protein
VGWEYKYLYLARANGKGICPFHCRMRFFNYFQTSEASNRHQVWLGTNGQRSDARFAVDDGILHITMRSLPSSRARWAAYTHDVNLRVLPHRDAVIAVIGNQHATLRASFCRASPTITATVISARITSEHSRQVPGLSDPLNESICLE